MLHIYYLWFLQNPLPQLFKLCLDLYASKTQASFYYLCPNSINSSNLSFSNVDAIVENESLEISNDVNEKHKWFQSILTDLLKKIPYTPDEEDATDFNDDGSITDTENLEVKNDLIEDEGTQIVQKILSDLINNL